MRIGIMVTMETVYLMTLVFKRLESACVDAPEEPLMTALKFEEELR